MPYFLPHVYPSPRAAPAPRPASAHKGLARRLTFLRAPISSFNSAMTSGTFAAPTASASHSSATNAKSTNTMSTGSASTSPSSASTPLPAWLALPPSPSSRPPPPVRETHGRTPAAGLSRARKARATTTVSLACVEGSVAAPAVPKTTTEENAAPEAVCEVKVTVETRVEVAEGDLFGSVEQAVAVPIPSTPTPISHDPSAPAPVQEIASVQQDIPAPVLQPIATPAPTRAASHRSLRALALPAQPQPPTETNSVPFPLSSPASPDAPPSAFSSADSPAASDLSSSSEGTSAYATARSASVSSTSSTSSDSSDSSSSTVSEDDVPRAAEESDTSVEDAPSSGEESMGKVLSAFPAPPAFLPVAFPSSPGPASPVSPGGVHYLLRVAPTPAASAAAPAQDQPQQYQPRAQPSQMQRAVVAPRARRPSTTRAPVVRRGVGLVHPPPVARTVSAASTSTSSVTTRHTSTPSARPTAPAPLLAASASVPQARRRMGALPRRSIVDDREAPVLGLGAVGGVLPERSRSPVLGRRAGLDGLPARSSRADAVERAVQEPSVQVEGERVEGEGTEGVVVQVPVVGDKVKQPEAPPPYCAPPPPYTVAPPVCAAPAVSGASSSDTALNTASTASEAEGARPLPSAPVAVPVVMPSPKKVRASQIPQLKDTKDKLAQHSTADAQYDQSAQSTSAQYSQSSTAQYGQYGQSAQYGQYSKRARVPSAELRLLVFLYRTVVAGLERRYRREQAAAAVTAYTAGLSSPLSSSPSSSASSSSSALSSPSSAASYASSASQYASAQSSPLSARSSHSSRSSSSSGSASSSRTPSPTGSGFARFPLVEDADADADGDVRGAIPIPNAVKSDSYAHAYTADLADDDDEIVLAPTPSPSPVGSPIAGGWHVHSPVRAHAHASAHARRRARAEEERRHRAEAERWRVEDERRRKEEERQRRDEEEKRRRERAEMDVQDAVLAIRLRRFLKAQGVPGAELDVVLDDDSEGSDGEEGRGDLELPEGVLLEEDGEEVVEEGDDEDAEAMAACEAEMERIRCAAAAAAQASAPLPEDDDDHILLAPARPAPAPRARTASGPPRPPRALRASPPPSPPTRTKSPLAPAALPASYMIALLTMRHRYAGPAKRPSSSPSSGSGGGGSGGGNGRRSRLGACAWMGGEDGVVVEDVQAAEGEQGVWDCVSVVEWYAEGME